MAAPPRDSAPVEQPPSVWAHAAWVVVPLALAEWLAVWLFGHRWPVDTGVVVGLGWLLLVGVAWAGTGKVGSPVVWAALLGGVAGLGWAVLALVAGVWSRLSWEVLGGAIGAFWVYYAVAKTRHEHWAAEWRKREAARREKLNRDKWPRILAEMGYPGIEPDGDPYEPQEGLVLVPLRLPKSGRVTFSLLYQSTEALEAAGGLRHGAVTWRKNWDDSSRVVLQVSYLDRLKMVFPYPGDTSNLSINNPFPIGVQETGEEMLMRLREVATFVVALRGKGKSNFLNVLIAQLARMPDVLIFMYDGKGGRTGVPWVRPWFDGACERPVIDWLAVERDEAERMLNSCLRAQQMRSRMGAGINAKVVPSSLMPAIILIVEESALIFSSTHNPRYSQRSGASNLEMSDLATQLVELGRSEAVDPVMATRRATVDNFGNPMLKNQTEQRVGFGMTDQGDATNAMGMGLASKLLARMRWPGAGVLRCAESKPVAFKCWFYEDPEKIYKHAVTCGTQRRPAPDPKTADALGRDYITRWSRFPADILTNLGVTLTTKQLARLSVAQHTEQDILNEIAAVEFGEDTPSHPGKPVLLGFLHEQGRKGATVHQMWQHLRSRGATADKSTIHDWLKQWIAAGTVVKHAEMPLYYLSTFAPKQEAA